jgi:hypothetical protein
MLMVSMSKTGVTCECSSPSVRMRASVSRSDAGCASRAVDNRSAPVRALVMVSSSGVYPEPSSEFEKIVCQNADLLLS